MWVQSSLKEGNRIHSTIRMAFCQELQHDKAKWSYKFDAIHLGLVNLVLSGMPLLTSEGLLFTGTMMYRYTSMTCFDKFLSLCFGFIICNYNIETAMTMKTF